MIPGACPVWYAGSRSPGEVITRHPLAPLTASKYLTTIYNMHQPIPESQVLRQCQDYLKAKGIYFWRCNNIAAPGRTFHGTKGVADLIAILPPYGTIIAIECKRPGGKQSPDQKIFEAEILRNGGMYILVDDVAILHELFRRTYALLDC